MNHVLRRAVTLFAGVGIWVATTAGAPIEGVAKLKDILKTTLQERGAKTLKKADITVTEADAKALQQGYGFEANPKYTIYTGLDSASHVVGSAVVVDIAGKEGPLQLVVAVDQSNGKIYNLGFTVFGEERGKPALNKTFLGQFIGFDKTKSFKVGKDVDGISGATWTTNAVTLGVQHAIGVFDYFVVHKEAIAREKAPEKSPQ